MANNVSYLQYLLYINFTLYGKLKCMGNVNYACFDMNLQIPPTAFHTAGVGKAKYYQYITRSG